MGVFSDNQNPAPFQTGPIASPPGVGMGPQATPNKPMDIRAQANRAKQRGTRAKQRGTPRQMLWQQMVSGTTRSAGHELIRHRGAIDRLVDRILYGATP
jgi:hypothetical protein